MYVVLNHIQSVYHLPNAAMSGQPCKTNTPSCLPVRGFGRPQALFIMESIISHIADELGIKSSKVQEINFFKNGQKFVNGVTVHDCTIQRCWETLLGKCSYEKRRKEVEEFNR